MKLVLITGMSGAGKGVALRTLEDDGFEAIDNMPLAYLADIAASTARTRNLAVAADIRSRDFSAEHFQRIISPFRENPDLDFKMLFLDADDEVLRRRYTETRRRHPLAQDRAVMDGIYLERKLIAPLKEIADVVIDTSDTEAADLRNLINSHLAAYERKLSLMLMSFSFKRGVPREADMVFDVRFLKNPHYDAALKEKTGLEKEVGAYIQKDAGYAEFIAHLRQLLVPLLPRFLEEGKQYLTIAIGCTGGKHRSVFVSEQLAEIFRNHGYQTDVKHRDVGV